MIDTTEWNQKLWFHTKGTREKWIVEDPAGNEFYFKTSIEKEGKHFPFEFWSEIIASKLGEQLGLPVLKYEVATSGNKIGCLCPSMLKGAQHLIEGVQYLQAYNPSFSPDVDKKGASKLYSFQFIEQALTTLGHSIYIRDIITIIIFDSIIGNQDRHQENWGTIIQYRPNKTSLFLQKEEVHSGYLNSLNLISRNRRFTQISEETPEYKSYQDLTYSHSLVFAPIYDSGSSLGRELLEDKVIRMLKSNAEFDAYVRKGRSEIGWNGEKLSHIDLVKSILHDADYADTETTIRRITSRYNEVAFKDLLDSICKEIPPTFATYILSESRKELIVRLVTTRINYLKSLL